MPAEARLKIENMFNIENQPSIADLKTTMEKANSTREKAVKSKVADKWSVNIVDFEIEYNQLWEKEMTKLEIETNYLNPIELTELVVNTFNRRRRFIKNK